VAQEVEHLPALQPEFKKSPVPPNKKKKKKKKKKGGG
jgi:hypothetical protein